MSVGSLFTEYTNLALLKSIQCYQVIYSAAETNTTRSPKQLITVSTKYQTLIGNIALPLEAFVKAHYKLLTNFEYNGKVLTSLTQFIDAIKQSSNFKPPDEITDIPNDLTNSFDKISNSISVKYNNEYFYNTSAQEPVQTTKLATDLYKYYKTNPTQLAYNLFKIASISNYLCAAYIIYSRIFMNTSSTLLITNYVSLNTIIIFSFNLNLLYKDFLMVTPDYSKMLKYYTFISLNKLPDNSSLKKTVTPGTITNNTKLLEDLQILKGVGVIRKNSDETKSPDANSAKINSVLELLDKLLSTIPLNTS